MIANVLKVAGFAAVVVGTGWGIAETINRRRKATYMEREKRYFVILAPYLDKLSRDDRQLFLDIHAVQVVQGHFLDGLRNEEELKRVLDFSLNHVLGTKDA